MKPDMPNLLGTYITINHENVWVVLLKEPKQFTVAYWRDGHLFDKASTIDKKEAYEVFFKRQRVDGLQAPRANCNVGDPVHFYGEGNKNVTNGTVVSVNYCKVGIRTGPEKVSFINTQITPLLLGHKKEKHGFKKMKGGGMREAMGEMGQSPWLDGGPRSR